MDDPVAVRVVERAGDLERVAKGFVKREPILRQPGGERVAVEAFHDEKVDLFVASDVVERADVRVCERGNSLRFAREPGAHLLIERSCRGKNFDRHLAIETCVDGAEDFAHAAGAEPALYAVGTEQVTRAQTRTFSEQRRSGLEDGHVEQRDGRLLAEQRLDFPAEVLVAGTELSQQRLARGCVAVDNELVDSGDLLPALRSQVHGCLLAITGPGTAAGAYTGA